MSEDTLKKDKLYVDMDDVLADFSGAASRSGWDPKSGDVPFMMYDLGFFLNLEILPGALRSMNELHASNLYDIYILSKPLAGNPHSFTEKARWVGSYFNFLSDKIILSPDKLIVKEEDSILIDDNLVWADWHGRFIHFKRGIDSEVMWRRVLRQLLPNRK